MRYGGGLLALAAEICTGHYDVLHVQGFKDARYEIPLYCKLKRHCGILVHTVHNLLPHEASPRDRRLYGDFYRVCDLLVVHNLYCRQLLMDEYHLPPEKICVTPHGSYTQISPKEHQLHTEKTEFLPLSPVSYFHPYMQPMPHTTYIHHSVVEFHQLSSIQSLHELLPEAKVFLPEYTSDPIFQPVCHSPQIHNFDGNNSVLRMYVCIHVPLYEY